MGWINKCRLVQADLRQPASQPPHSPHSHTLDHLSTLSVSLPVIPLTHQISLIQAGRQSVPPLSLQPYPLLTQSDTRPNTQTSRSLHSHPFLLPSTLFISLHSSTLLATAVDYIIIMYSSLSIYKYPHNVIPYIFLLHNCPLSLFTGEDTVQPVCF